MIGAGGNNRDNTNSGCVVAVVAANVADKLTFGNAHNALFIGVHALLLPLLPCFS
jgi:hypothetical protein